MDQKNMDQYADTFHVMYPLRESLSLKYYEKIICKKSNGRYFKNIFADR